VIPLKGHKESPVGLFHPATRISKAAAAEMEAEVLMYTLVKMGYPRRFSEFLGDLLEERRIQIVPLEAFTIKVKLENKLVKVRITKHFPPAPTRREVNDRDVTSGWHADLQPEAMEASIGSAGYSRTTAQHRTDQQRLKVVKDEEDDRAIVLEIDKDMPAHIEASHGIAFDFLHPPVSAQTDTFQKHQVLWSWEVKHRKRAMRKEPLPLGVRSMGQSLRRPSMSQASGHSCFAGEHCRCRGY
jgi:hypothetical protein